MTSEKQKLIFTGSILVIVLIIVLIGYSRSPERASTTGSPEPTRTSQAPVNIEEIFASNPLPDAPDEVRAAWFRKVTERSVEGSVIDVTSCSPEPVILRIKQNQTVTFINNDTESHRIDRGGDYLHLAVPAKSSITQTIKMPESGVFGYRCDGKLVGILYVP